jgi:hypothetical protein
MTILPKHIFKLPDSKLKKIISWSLVIAIVSGILLLVNAIYYQITKESPHESGKKEGYQYASPSQQIKDLTYTSHVDAQKRIVIQSHPMRQIQLLFQYI